MAAPTEKTSKNLSGKWVMNNDLSDSPEPVLQLQGIGYLIRKAVVLASITLELKQYDAQPTPPSTETGHVTHIDTQQMVPGLKPTQEKRCLDNEFRDNNDWLFGIVKTRARWVRLEDIDDEFLKKDWLVEGDGKTLILSSAESQGNSWTATQVWGFQIVNGERRYCARVLVINGKKRATARFVYDYVLL
ncbi:hypothetical protein EDB81DRAFT_911693 [Dactylonectria macrodidyma]|uniref:LCCL domain-containing protein n=1 Tax=Dactylonectria macrodidyma TaxID=307937 RepID=A0A9P9ILC5_9HYPO|nr:hypothetical protein EDB81DRAFT_911693 [Dactylonectria macrodidyma]